MYLKVLENILQAKTIRFGTETIHPDGQSSATGYMQLPEKWGFNGMYLGITGGRVDWIDPNETNDNKFGIANFGTVSKTTANFTDEDLAFFYYKYRNESVISELEERQSAPNIIRTETSTRLTSTIGLFNKAGGYASTAIGWENNVENNFSIFKKNSSAKFK